MREMFIRFLVDTKQDKAANILEDINKRLENGLKVTEWNLIETITRIFTQETKNALEKIIDNCKGSEMLF